VDAVVVAPDSFKGTASPWQAARALAAAVSRVGRVQVTCRPMSDGGEGFVEVVEPAGGQPVLSEVAGPLGGTVPARWLLGPRRAVVEAASACGLVLVGGPAGNRPLDASTAGVGQLLALALRHPVPQVLVGVGGTASTDGGLGAVEELVAAGLADAVAGRVRVACDVRTDYLAAADVFGPQKGAGPKEVAELGRRLARAAAELRGRFGRDPVGVPGSGAGGGLAGGLAALGAELVPGAPLVADLVGLPELLASASLVVTGEGRFDATSLAGKVVGTVLDLAGAHQVPVVVVAGAVADQPDHEALAGLVDLSATCGEGTARTDLAGAAAVAVPPVVASILAGTRPVHRPDR